MCTAGYSMILKMSGCVTKPIDTSILSLFLKDETRHYYISWQYV